MVGDQQSYSVREFTFYIKHLLEGDPLLQNVWVEGEISNLTHHRSGHIYFSLKDQDAQINCVMWRASAQNHQGTFPKHGEKIRAKGQVSVYPPRGNYQLVVQKVEKAGLGDLHQRFLALKEKLQKEGLFEISRKKSIPRIPHTLAVLTSPTGAVFQDILNTLKRLYPHVKVILIPTAVQGPAAAPQIAQNIERINAYGEAQVILLCRGGGSMEDLWGFNEEIVARAIAQSKIPIISGVGHETDTTIADFVADRRAATPTAAAELAVPIAADIRAYLDESQSRFSNTLSQFINYRRQLLDDYQDRLGLGLERMVERKKAEILGEFEIHLQNNVKEAFGNKRHQLELMEAQLKSMDMRQVLSRGYSVTMKDGKMIRDGSKLKRGDQVETVFEKGRRNMEVLD
ncbi:UNVERIFIED_CONTAM: hypothetical protein GTU68_003474 [Idotea baltica]|nr:hypothetical protein [Idotea baltica]